MLRSAGCACKTGRPRWRNQIGLTPRRQAAGRSAERAHVAIASPTTPYALPSWSQRIGFALARQSRERDPANWLIALRRRWHEGVLPGPHTTHIVRLVVPPTLILFAPTTPRAGTLRRGIKVRQCGVVCQSRCRAVTVTANPHLRARAGSHRASLQASFMPSPPRRWFF